MARTHSGSTPLIGFRRNLRIEVGGADRVHLFSERGMRVLCGRGITALAPLLDGSRALPDVVRDAPAELDPDVVTRMVDRLLDTGVLRTTPDPPDDPPPACWDDDPPDDPALAYWDDAGLDAPAAAAAVSAATVAVTGLDVDPDATRGALRTAGITVLPAGHPLERAAGLLIVLCTDYLDPRLARIDAARRAAGTPWLLAKPTGARIWIGPVFDPPGTACWHCLAYRLWLHRGAESRAQAELGHRGPAPVPDASVPAVGAVAANLVALQASKRLAGHRDPAQATVWTLDSLDLSGRHHELRRRPQCAACGDPDAVRTRMRAPVALRRRPRVAEDTGGHRAASPEAVQARYEHLISPVTGVVKEIRRDPRGPEFLNSFRSGANVAAAVRDLDGVTAALRMANGGKGVTAAQARVSALAEAVERYSGNFHGDEEQVDGTLRSLGADAVDPAGWLLFDRRQFAGRVEWNRAHGPFQHVPEPFGRDLLTRWSPVWSLTARRHRLLPTGLLYYGVPGPPALHAESNGTAAGASLEDAVLQGLLELVERDAVAVWWYNRSRVPGVDLAAFADPWIEQLHRVYAGLGREVWVLDVTSDLGVPASVAVSRKVDGPAEDIMFGFGAHLDPRIATRRALTELNQLLPTVLDPAPGTPAGRAGADPDAVRWWRDATVAEHPYLTPDPAVPAGVPNAAGGAAEADIAGEVDWLRGRLEALGLEVLVLDQTRPDIGLPVARVIVPGLRHFWARFAPGRLFDVPVRVGRATRPTRYADLNPVPMFL